MNQPPASVPDGHSQAGPQGATQTKAAGKGRSLNLGVVRFWWALAMLLGFLVSFLALMPSGESSGWSKEMTSAAARYSLQEGSAQGAPQQSVLNGWYANDLLAVQAKIAGDQKEQTQRISAMVFFLSLGVLGDMTLRRASEFRAARKA